MCTVVPTVALENFEPPTQKIRGPSFVRQGKSQFAISTQSAWPLALERSDWENIEASHRLSGGADIGKLVVLAFRFDRLVAGIASTEAPLAFRTRSLASNQPPSEPHLPSPTI
jgi:hypothetical protein